MARTRAPAAAPTTEETQAPTAAPKTVSMKRDEPMHARGPVAADVHPDEVENMQAFGWQVA